MLRTFLKSLYHRWKTRSLRAKLLVPIVGLMLISLLGSATAFIVGTVHMQNRLLARQTGDDAQIVGDALALRAGDVTTTAMLLAGDPNLQQAAQLDTEEALGVLNERAVRVRNRFNVDLIQIYDHQGQARTNLVLSSLYRESLLLGLVGSDNTPVIREAGDRVLLLSRATMASDSGTVIVGVDLETELHRIVSQYRLGSDVGLTFADVQMSTREELPFDVADGRSGGRYNRHIVLKLGDDSLDLLLTRSTADIKQITATGLAVMTSSVLLTTLLLVGLSAAVTYVIARPIHQIAEAAEAVAQGDMEQRVDIGGQDEVGMLAASFNSMVAELRSLYGDLEIKVETRTHELKTSAEVARVVSSSLDLEAVLQKTTELIQKRLGFYYVGIYLIKPGADVAVLSKATGKRGEYLTQQGFQILIGSNCPVGLAASTRKPSIVHDVRAKQAHLKPPLLLDTFSAVGIPLMVGESVIGVIDVQSRRRYACTSEQVGLLIALADQIATGVNNAQLYTRQRRMVEQLTEADRLKTQFLAIISHELRTPLNSIIGFSKILLKGADGPLSDVQAEDIRIIHDAGQHLLLLIQDILDVSQIMLNLLSNAAKFTETGQISVQARVIRAFNPDNGQMEPFIEVSVSDTGVGISRDRQRDIFKEFAQVDGATTRRQEEGIGLGLPITKKLVELHGGRIWVKSQVDQGSTFAFSLPLSQPEVRVPQTLEVIETSGQEVSYVA